MSWASFHVLEVMSSSKYLQKRVGYLGAVQSFRPDTEVLMLATNMLKKVCLSQLSTTSFSTFGPEWSGLQSNRLPGHRVSQHPIFVTTADHPAAHCHSFAGHVPPSRHPVSSLTFKPCGAQEDGCVSLQACFGLPGRTQVSVAQNQGPSHGRPGR